jgi:hypothetical protein
VRLRTMHTAPVRLVVPDSQLVQAGAAEA